MSGLIFGPEPEAGESGPAVFEYVAPPTTTKPPDAEESWQLLAAGGQSHGVFDTPDDAREHADGAGLTGWSLQRLTLCPKCGGFTAEARDAHSGAVLSGCAVCYGHWSRTHDAEQARLARWANGQPIPGGPAGWARSAA